VVNPKIKDRSVSCLFEKIVRIHTMNKEYYCYTKRTDVWPKHAEILKVM